MFIRVFPLLIAFVATGCAINPVTGQHEFVLMSEEQELTLGRQGHAEVIKEYGIYDNVALQAFVQRVGEGLAAKSHRQDLVYRFTVLDSKEVNAFALPGGYIYITRGLLAYLNSEAELAAVLGHEIGHVTARHSVRQYSATQAANIGATIAAIFIPELRTQTMSQVVNILGTALLRGYGRNHELEADRLGAEYLARSGYSPWAMLDVIRQLKDQEILDIQLAKEEGREPRSYHGLFSTHPDNDTRLQEVIGYVATPRPSGTEQVNREGFLELLDGLIVGDSPREGVVRGNNFYHADLGFALRFPEGWTIKNLPDRIVAQAPYQAAVLQVTAEDLNKRISPREFMITRLGLEDLRAEGPIAPAELEGYSAVATVGTGFGRREARFNVIYFQDKAYIIAGLVKNPQTFSLYDTAFLETAQGLHPLTEEERIYAKPLRLHIIRATEGITFRDLARDSPLPAHKEEHLRLLNGLYPQGELAAGQLLKVVR